MTWLDWVLLGFAALCALGGFQRGLIGAVLSLAGLMAGAVIGSRVAPHLLADGKHSEYTALVGLVGAIAGAVIGHLMASLIGTFIRGGLRLLPPLRFLDSLGGLIAGAAWGLALIWIGGAVALQINGHPKVRRDVKQSHVLRRLDKILPPKDLLRVRLSLERPYISIS